MKSTKELEAIGNQLLKNRGTGYDSVILSELSGVEKEFGLYVLSSQRQEYIRQNSKDKDLVPRLSTVQKDDFSEFQKLKNNKSDEDDTL